jgi:hypothetical protein
MTKKEFSKIAIGDFVVNVEGTKLYLITSTFHNGFEMETVTAELENSVHGPGNEKKTIGIKDLKNYRVYVGPLEKDNCELN